MGRPSEYTEELAARICEEIASTKLGLKAICDADENLPSERTVYRWIAQNDTFCQRYARSKERQAELIADEMLEIADDGSNDYMTITRGDEQYNVEDKEVTSRSRLRIDTRKWLLAKLLPKKYGDKLDMTVSGEISLAERISKARQAAK